MGSLSDSLTEQFYDWEIRGRGWNAYPYPVHLEPQFHPLIIQVTPRPYVDDGRKPGILEKIEKAFTFSSKPKEEVPEVFSYGDLTPFEMTEDLPLQAWIVAMPKGEKCTLQDTEGLLCMLSECTFPISFELLATHDAIRMQFVCRDVNAGYIGKQLKAFFPMADIEDGSEAVEDILSEEYKGSCVVDFGLHEEFLRPLAAPRNFDPDPLIGIIGFLETLEPGQRAVIQILFQGTINPWAGSMLDAVTDSDGECFFPDAPEMLPLTREKVASPLFSVVLRAFAQAQTDDIAIQIVKGLSSAVINITRSATNSLFILSNTGYDAINYTNDVFLRQSHRIGMLLNSKELAMLVHLPSASVVSEKLKPEPKKTKRAPTITVGHRFSIGINMHKGVEEEVTLPPLVRMKHMHVIGATGTGKSTFLLRSIIQDIEAGEGVAVLDPHGDLIESILAFFPKERSNDVVYIDPADAEYPVGFNILTAHSEIEKDILSSDLVAVFRRQSTSWGDQMNSILANAILAFLESSRGGTLMDMRRFLIEKPFRQDFLQTVEDDHVLYYWKHEFPMLRSNAVSPILTRLDSFLRPKFIRNMVSQNKGLDFENFLDRKKIVLVKLSQGLIGSENSYLLGTFIVSKLQQAAMARQAKAKSDRAHFFVYIDEFQNFITPSMAQILSGARKYNLGLILAHQDMQQLSKHDPELANAVLSNAGTRICFRVGDADAKRLADGLSFFDAKDLMSQDTGSAICRVERADFDFNIRTIPVEGVDSEAINHIEHILNLSRKQYGTPRDDINTSIKGKDVEETTLPIPDNTIILSREKAISSPQPATNIENTLTPEEENAVKVALSQKQKVREHVGLQRWIKKMAEDRGFKATIEEPTPDGKGFVDVSLSHGDLRIAVEVNVTSKEEWELHNIAKCLQAGYGVVIECCSEQSMIERIKAKVNENLSSAYAKKILVVDREGLMQYLNSVTIQETSTEKRIKGYRVKINYESQSEKDVERMKASVAKSVVDGVKSKNL